MRKTHQEDVRAKIQTSQLLNRLTDHALSDKPILDASQVRAIDIMLKKVLPDLQSTQHSGDANNPLVHEVRRSVVRP